MVHQKKAQAAMEFLTTYGWMFLVVLVAIGAMTYFGFTDVKSKVPSTCYFGTEFECGPYMITENGSVSFQLTNLQSRSIVFNKSIISFY